MPGAYTLEWRDGRKVDLFGHRGYYYVFPDQTILSFHPDPAWCHHCGQIRLCEHLRGAAEISKELRSLADPNSDLSLKLAVRMKPRALEAWRRKLLLELRHATLRTMSPSCLDCGERRVAHFVLDQWAPHPGTGDEVHFSLSGLCSTDFAKKFYDVECIPLKITEAERWKLREAVHQQRAY